eukprot:GHVR01179490.1.p1 GENE.GHVR01179490.1~~GHVR01179490.1.p1  ORF type:complete len:284 (-),score=115.29 GHVR01179490.1:970-1821(-)
MVLYYFIYVSRMNYFENEVLRTHEFEGFQERFIKEKMEIEKSIEEKHGEWDRLLDMGFTVVVYGFGSKYHILENFANRYNDNNNSIIVVDAADMRISLFDLIIKFLIKEKVLNNTHTHTYTCQTILNKLESVVRRQNNKNNKNNNKNNKNKTKGGSCLLIVIHSIDSIHMRNGVDNDLLCRLCDIEGVYMICSVDQSKFPLLWDTTHTRSLNLLYFKIDTHRNYKRELLLSGVYTHARDKGDAHTHTHTHNIHSLTDTHRFYNEDVKLITLESNLNNNINNYI